MLRLRKPWDSQPQEAVELSPYAQGLGFTHIFNWGEGLTLARNAINGSTSALTNPSGAIVMAPGAGGIGATKSADTTDSRWEVAGNPFATSTGTWLWIEACNGGGALGQGQALVDSRYSASSVSNSGSLQIRTDGSKIVVLRAQQAVTLDAVGGRVDGALNVGALSVAGNNGRHAYFTRGRLHTEATPASTYVHGTSAIGNSAYIAGTQDVRFFGPLYFLAFAPVVIPDAVLADLTRSLSAPYEKLFAPRSIWIPVSAGGAATHATTGVLSGAGAAIDGTAARTRAHASEGILAGSGGVIDGTAARVTPSGEHATSGALAGAGATVSGTAAHIATHQTSGALVGGGAVVDGAASGPIVNVAVGGGGWLPKMRRKTRKELHAERVRLGILPPDVVKAAAKAAVVVMDEPSPVKAYKADPEAVNKVFLRELGVSKMLPDYRRAIQIQIELQQQEDEDLLLFF